MKGGRESNFYSCDASGQNVVGEVAADARSDDAGSQLGALDGRSASLLGKWANRGGQIAGWRGQEEEFELLG